MIRHILLGASFCMAAATAVADEIEASGTGMGTSTSTPHPVTESHMLMEMHTEYSDFTFEDEDHPMAGMSGPCFGAIEMMAGAVSGGGKCLYTDAGGDLVAMDWSVDGLTDEGALTGTWEVSGGTGKWMEAQGGGTFASLTDPETGENVNNVVGTVTIP